MNKCKIFKAEKIISDLEEQINKWLKDNNILIIHSNITYGRSENRFSDVWEAIVMIIYQDHKIE